MKLPNTGEKAPPRYRKITVKWVFDIKLDFTRVERFVVGVNLANQSQAITYRSVLSIYEMRILFIIDVLNDLNVRFSDNGSEYLNKDIGEKIYFIYGKLIWN